MMRDGERPAQHAHDAGDSGDVGDAGDAGEESDDFSVTPLDPSHQRRGAVSLGLPHDVQRRVAALGTTTLVVALVALVAVGLFTHATSDPGGALATLLRQASPPPAATFVPGANSIYFSNGAPWGTLTIDGKRLPSADPMGYAIAVTRGTHSLNYQARYFPSLRCTFSAPRAQSDTCPLDTSDATMQFLLTHPLARAIDLGSTGASLQPDQFSALTQLADSMLQAQSLTATIASGERYLDGQGRLVTASAPLRFTLTLALATQATHNTGDSSACAQFCPSPPFSVIYTPPGSGWLMRMTTATYWAVTDTSGRHLTPQTYQAGQQGPGLSTVEVGIHLTSAGWQITDLENVNIQAVEMAAGDLVQQAVDAANSGVGFGDSLQFAPNPLDGGVMEVTYGGATSRVLWRFGALLAVDAAAHRVFPQLPVATAAEQALAARIAPEPPSLRDDSILPTGQS